MKCDCHYITICNIIYPILRSDNGRAPVKEAEYTIKNKIARKLPSRYKMPKNIINVANG